MVDAGLSPCSDHMMSDDGDLIVDGRGLRVAVSAVLVVVGGALDFYIDGRGEWNSPHVVLRMALMAVSAIVGVMLWRAWRRTTDALAVSERSRTATEADRSAWQRRAEHTLQGLGNAIDTQFDLWQLTPAEREVALASLQGRGRKQIAYRTGRSDSTERQHAVGVYGKSGQSGRAELAAFFRFRQKLTRPRGAPPYSSPDASTHLPRMTNGRVASFSRFPDGSEVGCPSY